MENGNAAASWRIWIHASRVMAEIQGKVANGKLPVELVRTIGLTIYPRNSGKSCQWRTSCYAWFGGLSSYHLSQKSGTSSQWRTVPEPGIRPLHAGTDASPGLPMGNGAMEDGEVP